MGASRHTGRMVSVTDAHTPATRFRLVAVLEAISWAGLLIAMFLKYVVVKNQIGVQVMGPIHGTVFIAYVLLTLLVARPLAWSRGTTILALVASVPPFGSIVFERWAAKRGNLAELSLP